ncbi:Nitrogen Permease regulator of amino acid transport activity 3 [Trichophyton interdigitale]|nr:Nitrogen Permease regulator of amino acid transport activity 3 [Trichophyton interdigitale]KAG5216664.1 Nitrogen Permease regulator of amino acid transport activity 3 [Trichophyton interdigitale]KAG8209925.1 Nitrogen Permease regulator of amino acid transport activity 3 [Trichophyton interdigitale]
MRYRRRVYIPPTTISIADSMSSVIRPPDPCLIAIALVVRSRAGPRFVYHYPPNPTLAESPSTAPNKYDGAQPRDEQEHEQADPDQEGKGTDSGASVDEEGVTSEEEASVVDRSERERERDRRSPSRQHSQHSQHSHSQSQSHSHSHSHVRKKVAIQGQGAPGEEGAEEKKGEGSSLQADSFLGLGYGVWEKLLSPSPAWHKRRFEVGVNDLTFVGWPVFVRKDGTWRKRRKKHKSEKSEKKREDEKEKSKKSVSGLGAGLVGDGNIPLTDTEDGEDGGDEREDGEDEECSDEEQLTIKDGMTMFNVVFVLNAPALEYNVRVREMYDNVVKKFGKALKSEQARANYVWKEAQSILRIKEKCREERTSLSGLYTALSAKSSLAQAIETLYTNISASKIASVSLGPQTSMSMQIPPMTSTPHLPSPNEPGYPGLWLTTADSVSSTDETAHMANPGQSQVMLAKHFALLLLSDETSILKDIEASKSTIGPPLAHYIRSSKPTKSFAQISARSHIPLADIQILASHLVYWRRARAIPPLNKKDVYIVSPNADMSKLGVASAAYEGMFPTLPSLPKMLSALSAGSPRPYFSYIPSKDHKEAYYDILAWLVRGGWVTQLRTFGWVKVSPEVKMAVQSQPVNGHGHQDEDEDDGLATPVNGDGHQGEDEDEDEDDGLATPVPAPKSTSKPWISTSTASLILRPHRASPLESRWLDYIHRSFPLGPEDESSKGEEDGEEEGEEEEDVYAALRRHWPMLTRYFTGLDALQKISVREGLPHRLVWRMLNLLDVNSGVLGGGSGGAAGGEVDGVWDEREKVLVTVRHW